MPDIEVLPVLVATVAAFLIGGAYYAALGEQLAQVGEAHESTPWTVAVEVMRCLVLAVVVAGLASQGRIDEWTGGLLLGFALWIGFPVVLWVGAMVHERVPPRLAAIHAGDWLAKLLAVAVIVSAWQ
jgi:Protein of unknown function (DUF1761)